ncbi:MAG: hypothetical protein NT069_02945, partial [Planctomycetota bacterium]|nr:hypothetical protein [Planctomycetota bacterium]
PLVTGPTAPQGVDPSQLGARGEPLLVEFGDLPVRMYQVTMTGDPESAWSELHNRVRAVLTSEPSNAVAESDNASEPAASEKRILELASQLEPSEEIARTGGVFRFSEWFAGAFSIRYGTGETRADQIRSGRLVAWGLLVPNGTDGWRIFQFERTGVATEADRSQIPAPPGGMRILATGSEAAGRLVAFRGSGRLSDWRDHFASWFAGHKWEIAREWGGSLDTTGALYQRITSRGSEWAEIRLLLDDAGSIRAVVQIYGAGD